MKDKCPKMIKNKDDGNEVPQRELGLVAATNGTVSSFGIISKMDGHEIVMVINTEIELCLLVEEAGERGVLDSACSKTVAGRSFVKNYISKLPESMQNAVNEGMPSKTVYQFGGGECRFFYKEDRTASHYRRLEIDDSY